MQREEGVDNAGHLPGADRRGWTECRAAVKGLDHHLVGVPNSAHQPKALPHLHPARYRVGLDDRATVGGAQCGSAFA